PSSTSSPSIAAPSPTPAAAPPHHGRFVPRRVALETTLLIHGVPRTESLALAHELSTIVRTNGAQPALVGVVHGQPRVGMTDDELRLLLDQPSVPKLNTASLGPALFRKQHGATTVSTTMELAAGAGVRLFATGGLGGVHRNLFQRLDISADLSAFTRFPVAVVTSGCKSILDVINTREALETLGVTVVGFRTDRFPAFYCRDGGAGVDARFDDEGELAQFIHDELPRTARGIVVCNPIPQQFEIPANQFESWLKQAQDEANAKNADGRDVTPAILGALHRLSGGATLKANIELVKDNARLAARLA
ncbi:MAG: pseudouridine-5'-phosphate glycosidase, partial [Phycisphaerales bacterium]|nr:pseudouridine-5'-phosphate glycosidase [Phycisphaerales bacterium]